MKITERNYSEVIKDLSKEIQEYLDDGMSLEDALYRGVGDEPCLKYVTGITCQAKYDEIVSDLANGVQERCEDEDGCIDYVNDYIMEDVGNSRYAIYIAYHDQILEYCSNRDAYLEMGGCADKSFSDFIACSATCALEEDVRNELIERGVY